MSMRRKLLWLSTAAASGGKANVQVAWRALQSRLFPELLLTKYYMTFYPDVMDPATAASESGHFRVIPEVLDTCPGFVRPYDLLSSAAEFADLSGPFGLQATWNRLYTADQRRLSDALEDPSIIEAAMASRTPYAEHKVAWLLKKGATLCAAALAGKALALHIPFLAAQGGGLDRLVWLCAAHDSESDRHKVLGAALMHCDLAAVQWLLDRGLCTLPRRLQNLPPNAGFNAEHRYQCGLREWEAQLSAAACSHIDGVAKLKLLQENWAPLDVASVAAATATAAAGAGELDTLRYMYENVGTVVLADWTLVVTAVRSGSTPAVAWLLQRYCPLDNESLSVAAQRGDLAMVRWLLQEAKLRPGDLDLGRRFIALWPYRSRWDSARLLQAVRLVLQASVAAATAPLAAAAAGGGGGGPLPLQLTSTLSAAATRGDLDLVRLLVQERELVPDAAVFSAAAGSGCEALLEWLAARGCPSSADAWVQALACMRRLGVPWDEGVLGAAAGAKVPEPVLEWLKAECAPAEAPEEGQVVVALG